MTRRAVERAARAWRPPARGRGEGAPAPRAPCDGGARAAWPAAARQARRRVAVAGRDLRRRTRGAAPPPPRRPAPQAAAPARPARDLEDILGGSVLAWLGGFAVLAGLAFLLTIAISRGWLGEAERTLLAGALSAGLLAIGVWLRERRDQTEAALAAAAVGVAGLFGTLVVAGPVYDLIPNALALAGAAAVGAAATDAGGALEHAGVRAGSACSARCGRRPRSARSTPAASRSWPSRSQPPSPCSCGSAGSRSRGRRRRRSPSSGCGGSTTPRPATPPPRSS